VIFEGGSTNSILKQEYAAQFSENVATICGISGNKGNYYKLCDKFYNF
jgi:hypothetical protein